MSRISCMEKMSRDSILKPKSLRFAGRIVKLYQYLEREHHESVMSRQVLRCVTSIGATIAEAIYGSSRKDFVAKLQIAQKEASEPLYWLELLYDCKYLSPLQYRSMPGDCNELMAMLAATIKSVKG